MQLTRVNDLGTTESLHSMLSVILNKISQISDILAQALYTTWHLCLDLTASVLRVILSSTIYDSPAIRVISRVFCLRSESPQGHLNGLKYILIIEVSC